jgi:hypothetical protein
MARRGGPMIPINGGPWPFEPGTVRLGKPLVTRNWDGGYTVEHRFTVGPRSEWFVAAFLEEGAWRPMVVVRGVC